MTYFNGDNETADAEDIEEEESIFETSVATEDSDIRGLNKDFQLMDYPRINGVLQIGSNIFTAPEIDNLPPPAQIFPQFQLPPPQEELPAQVIPPPPLPLPQFELPPPAQEELPPPPLPDIEPEEQEQELPPPPAPRRRRETNPARRLINDRRNRRNSEKKKFQEFYDSLDKNEYTSNEIVREYNEYYNLDQNHQISHCGFGRLNEVKAHFTKKQKDIRNNKKIMIYKKNQ